ncbi:hypothetical protein, partial [Alistipes senegalensis]|uniref:hypothetical protein n=2 Tax=Alistipes senegalensis TaxID=1288121 RepID=UPI001E48A28C
ARPPDRKKTRRQPAGFPGPAAGIHKHKLMHIRVFYLFKDCTESPPPKVRGKILSVFQIYSLINRLLIVNRVKQGETIAHLSKKYHINKIQILVMARMWDTYDRFSIRNGRIVVPH